MNGLAENLFTDWSQREASDVISDGILKSYFLFAGFRWIAVSPLGFGPIGTE